MTFDLMGKKQFKLSPLWVLILCTHGSKEYFFTLNCAHVQSPVSKRQVALQRMGILMPAISFVSKALTTHSSFLASGPLPIYLMAVNFSSSPESLNVKIPEPVVPK